MVLIYMHACDDPLRLDLDLLKKQKMWLECQNSEEAEGLIGVVDFLQDYLVNCGGYTEKEVFGSEDSDE